MDSTINCIKSCRTASGRPMRATLTPARDRPSTRLSTAMFESEVHRIGEVRFRSHICTSATAVCVLPVPGGPWMSVTLWNSAASSASVWDLFMCAIACRSIALSIIRWRCIKVRLGSRSALHISGMPLMAARLWSQPATRMSRMAGSTPAFWLVPGLTSTMSWRALSWRRNDVRLASLSTLHPPPRTVCACACVHPTSFTLRLGNMALTSASNS
mmetsp:Transcript_6891/g.18768  ORF Transcript_6891/g.18768 Transcript_6891/m.18768 type:complete len:214 (-) Transcript_6891:41-682(-)